MSLISLQQSVKQLQESEVDAIAVDVTGNGGGSEWAEDVARLFTTKHLEARGGSLIKHAHWENQISREIQWINDDLATGALPQDISTMLEVTLAEHEDLLTVIRDGCDASSLWESRTAQLDCSRLTNDPHGRYRVCLGFDNP